MKRKNVVRIAKTLAICLSVLLVTAGVAYALGTKSQDRLRDGTKVQLQNNVCSPEAKVLSSGSGTSIQSRNRAQNKARTALREKICDTLKSNQSRNMTRTKTQTRERTRERTRIKNA